MEERERPEVKCAEPDRFQLVGIRRTEPEVKGKRSGWYREVPWLSAVLLSVILLGCLCSGLAAGGEPAYMDLRNSSVAPNREFLFGTDTMGRDIFSMIWYGGRISLLIGFLSAAVSAGIAAVIGTVCALAPEWLDALLMRMTEILLSVPGLLLVIFVQAILGKTGILPLSLAIGITGWAGMAKVIRTEVQQLAGCEFVLAVKCMGGSFWHILRRHLAPNFFPSILFMMVMNIRSAIAAESTLSFMGIGLPLDVVSWGSMLSLSENALLSGAWWMILIPGGFLAVTLLCITELAEALRRKGNRRNCTKV